MPAKPNNAAAMPLKQPSRRGPVPNKIGTQSGVSKMADNALLILDPAHGVVKDMVSSMAVIVPVLRATDILLHLSPLLEIVNYIGDRSESPNIF